MTDDRHIFQLRHHSYETIGLPVGQGAYGVVWKARRMADGKIVALKTVQTRRDDGSAYGSGYFKKIIDVQKWEIAFLRRVGVKNARKHHILPLLDDGQTDAFTVGGKPAKTPVMVFPFCRDNLSAFVRERDARRFPFDMDMLLAWISKIAEALKYLHGLKTEEGVFVHRDLKFQNVLVSGDDLFLCDFGTVRARKTELTRTFAGTPLWAAPEMLIPPSASEHYQFGPPADIYALGLMLFALITASGTAAQRQSNDLITASGKPVPGAWDKFGQIGGLTPKETDRFMTDVRRLLSDPDKTIIPTDLPDIEAIADPLKQLVLNMLAPQAKARPSAQDCIRHINQIHAWLHPQIDALTLTAPQTLELGRPCPLRITVKGKGLPQHAAWLHATLNQKEIELKGIQAQSLSVWEAAIDPPQQTGNYTLQAYTVINGERIVSKEQRVTVTASPDQLWRSGRHVEALIHDPDRLAFLNELDAKAQKDAAFQKEYVRILDKVLAVYPRHEQINLRYWGLRVRMKDANQVQKSSPNARPETLSWSKKIVLAVTVLLLGFVAAYFIFWNDPSEPTYDKTLKDNVTAFENKKTEEKKKPQHRRKIVAQEGRFIAYDDDGDGKSDTVADTRTGLMWAARDNGSDINWYDAKTYCENYRGGGYTDWRIPTLDELESLYDKSEEGYRPKCTSRDWKVHLTPLITLTCCCPWAKETKEDGSRAAGFNFLLGGGRHWNRPRFGSRRALPVRVGN